MARLVVWTELSPADMQRLDWAVEVSQVYGKTRAGFVRNATLRAIEALETGKPPADAPRQPGNGRTSSASLARNGSRTRGRK